MSFKDTEIGLIPSDWNVVKLGTQVQVLSGYAFKSKDYQSNGVPVIKIKNITPPNITLDDVQLVSDELYEMCSKYQVFYDDILISMTGSNYNQMSSAVGKVGRVRIKNEKMLLNQRVGKIITDENKSNKDFIYHILSTYNTQYRLALSAGGSANQANISPKQIGDLLIPSPPIKEQKAIAHILSTLDEKIELNNKINETLENMAQEIFKRWFIDFEFPNEDGEPYKSCGGEMVESELGLIPRGWEIVSLDNLTSRFTTGLNPRKNFVLGHGDNYYVTIKNMIEQDVILDDRCDKIDNQALFIINKRSDLKRRDILFSGIGTIGRVYFIDEEPKNWNISESIFTLRAKNDRVSEYLYFLLLSSNFQMYAKQLASGSVQKGIRMADLKKYKLAFSLDIAANKFYEVANLILKTYKNNKKENRKLVKMRDALLPKLMSGEIRVPIEEL